MVYYDGKFICCEATGKRCYSRRAAGSLLNSLKRHRRKGEKEIPRRSYYCSECRHYHLTSMSFYRKSPAFVIHENAFYREYETRNIKRHA